MPANVRFRGKADISRIVKCPLITQADIRRARTLYKGFVRTTLLATVEAQASCATMQKLAQEHSNDMARRGSMDHAGFTDRACRGARAENVAAGVKTRSAAIALWWASPGHAANMRLPGCKALAHAVGRGVYYWTMVIGQ